MTNPLTTVWKHRKVLWATTKSDIRGKYAGTILGLVWTIAYPLCFLGLYAIVFTMIFRVRVANYETAEYVLLIFCGLIPFLGFSESLGNGVTSVTSNKGLIKNTLFPIELIPVKAVLASSTTMVVGLVVLLAVLWSRGIVHDVQLMLPVIFVLQLLFTIGLMWILSAVNVFLPDLGQMVSIIILLLMLVSPIAYTHEMIPPELLPIMYPNPLYYLIMLYRDAAFVGVVRLDMLATFSILSAFSLFTGAFVFSRLKTVFVDHV